MEKTLENELNVCKLEIAERDAKMLVAVLEDDVKLF